MIELTGQIYTSRSGGDGSDYIVVLDTNTAKPVYLVSIGSLTAGSFIDYIYSTNSTAYPNGGVKDGYYYDQRAELSFSTIINVPPQAMQGNQITVSWTAVDGADSYILERKADTDADWVQVYSGANLTFSEVVGTWTSVQYRVKAGVSGTYGDYTTSASVPVVSASAVVISGSDGNLGTLVNDVSYTVSSNGTNPLTVTEIINGTTARTFTATNGATIRIPVIDLPTGTGTIKITASTNPGSGVVTVMRNWTYTKTAPTFANTGSTAQLQQNGKNIFPLTLLECVRGRENLAPGGFGLGTVAVNISDLNDATKNGWYMNAAGGEAVHAPDNVAGWLVLVCAYADEIVFQTAYRYGSDEGLISARRSYHYLFGGWQPWEWINPPMQIGVEYRTTERYNGKPVFVMAVDGGVFPNSSSKTIEVQIPDTSGQVKMLDCYGVLDNGTQIPGLFGESVFDASNYLGLFTQNGNGKFTISVGSGRTVGLNFTLILKYWKEGT